MQAIKQMDPANPLALCPQHPTILIKSGDRIGAWLAGGIPARLERGSAADTHIPFNQRRSLSKLRLAITVVLASRSAWSSVMLTDEFSGRFNLVSRLPQYLIRAMLVGAQHVTIGWTSAMLQRGAAVLCVKGGVVTVPKVFVVSYETEIHD